MPKFTFPDGRWVDLRPMWVLDELAFDDLAEKGSALEEARTRFRTAQAALAGAVTDDEKATALAAAAETLATLQAAYAAQRRAVYAHLRDATTATSWDGELGVQVTSDEMFQLARRWRVASEDETLPPV